MKPHPVLECDCGYIFAYATYAEHHLPRTLNNYVNKSKKLIEDNAKGEYSACGSRYYPPNRNRIRWHIMGESNCFELCWLPLSRFKNKNITYSEAPIALWINTYNLYNPRIWFTGHWIKRDEYLLREDVQKKLSDVKIGIINE